MEEKGSEALQEAPRPLQQQPFLWSLMYGDECVHVRPFYLPFCDTVCLCLCLFARPPHRRPPSMSVWPPGMTKWCKKDCLCFTISLEIQQIRTRMIWEDQRADEARGCSLCARDTWFALTWRTVTHFLLQRIILWTNQSPTVTNLKPQILHTP